MSLSKKELPKNVQAHLIHINNIFHNDISIKEEIDINLYNNKVELVEYFHNKYSINDSILIYNNKLLDNLNTIDINSDKDLIVIYEKIPPQSTFNNMFTSIVNNILDGNIPINLSSNPEATHNQESISLNHENSNPVSNLDSNIINDFISNIQQNFPLVQPHQEFNNFEYSDELEELKSMGFSNINLNKEALIISSGNIEMSINYILENR
jgi:hypothetical protein